MKYWSYTPYVGTHVLNSNNVHGIITDVLDNNFFIVAFDDGTIEAINIDNLFPFAQTHIDSDLTTVSPLVNTEEINPDMPIHTDWNWFYPFAVNQRVALNPSHRYFNNYNNNTNNTFGNVIEIPVSLLNNWISPDICSKSILVKWDNGFVDSFQISALLPVGEILYQPNTNIFKIGTKIRNNLKSSLYHDQEGFVIDVRDNIVAVIFILDNFTSYNFIFKDFLEIIDDKIYEIIRYDIIDYGYVYNADNLNSKYLDNLIINHHHRLTNSSILNENNK